jgi:hypothetical protein
MTIGGGEKWRMWQDEARTYEDNDDDGGGFGNRNWFCGGERVAGSDE